MRNLFLKENIFKNCLILLFGINICQSCIKKNLPDYYMDESFKSYVDFPKGSYWIYNEMNTNNRDSVFLFARKYFIVTNSRAYNYNYDEVDTKYFSSAINDTLSGGGGQTGLVLMEFINITKALKRDYHILIYSSFLVVKILVMNIILLKIPKFYTKIH